MIPEIEPVTDCAITGVLNSRAAKHVTRTASH
jgi:hypothetical protein